MTRWGKIMVVLLVCAVLSAGILPAANVTGTARADGEKQVTVLGAEASTRVYFGTKGTPILFNVLKTNETAFGSTTVLLDCASVLEQREYSNNENEYTEWSNSTIRAYLNGTFLNNRFTDTEKEYIVSSTKSDLAEGEYENGSSFGMGRIEERYYFQQLTGEKIFLLDDAEARSCNDKGGDWWLRTRYYYIRYRPSGDDNSYWKTVYKSGDGRSLTADATVTCGVSPALNINQRDVIFSSAVPNEPDHYKLTLRDSKITLGTMGPSANYDAGTNKVTVSFMSPTGVHKDNVTRISVVMTDGTWESGGWSSGAQLKFYGKLSQSSLTDTTGTFTLPSDYDCRWHTYLIAEDENSGKAPDLASPPVMVTMPELHTYDGQVYTKWNEGTSLPAAAGNYFLSRDVQLSSNWVVPQGTVRLILNGHDITKTSVEEAVSIPSGATLNLYEYAEEPGEIKHDKQFGSGVRVNGGTFNMHGGKITGNTSVNGGGVCVDAGTFNMSGGIISGNTVVTLSGGCYGGGVYCGANGEFRLSGNADISGNKNYYYNNAADNIYLSTGKVIRITGALTGSKAFGVRMETPGVFTSGLKTNNGTLNSANIADRFTSEMSGYNLGMNAGGEALLSPHVHSWSYSSDGRTLTAVCSGEGDCHETAGLTLTISAPDAAALVYDGTEKAASLNDDYSRVAFPAAAAGIRYMQGDGRMVGSAVNAQTYTAFIPAGQGVDEKRASVTFTIAKANADVVADPQTKVYGGADPVLTSTDYGVIGTDTLDYTLARDPGENVGEYAIRVVPGNNQNYDIRSDGSTFTITKAAASITADPKTKVYGDPDPVFTAVVTGTIGDDALDYTLTRNPGSSVGDYPIAVVLGNNPNYDVQTTGSLLTITRRPDADVVPVPSARSGLVYTGSAQELVSVGPAIDDSLQLALGFDDRTVPGGGWSANIPTATDAGTWYVWYSILSNSNHDGAEPACVTVSIAPKSIENAVVTLNTDQYRYTGNEQVVRVTGVSLDGKQLSADDYSVESGYFGTEIGSYTVIVTGKGNYMGSARAGWKILGKAMTVSAENVNVVYDGQPHGITVTVTEPQSGAAVKYGKAEGAYDLDASPTITEAGTLTVYYRVTAADYEDCTGSATVTVTKENEEGNSPDPSNPTNPDGPANPTNPDNPSNPTNPDNPQNPDNPSNPSNPDSPSNPDNPSGPDPQEAVYTVTVTVNNKKMGTASADPASGKAGTEVALAAEAKAGYLFKEWKVISGGVEIKDNRFVIGTANVEVQAVFEKMKDTVTAGSLKYKLNHKKKTATVTGPAKKTVKKISIPKTVKANGLTYKVTAVGKRAFKSLKKLTQVTIGENVTTIGQDAFLNCKKLVKVTIKTKKLTKKTIGKNCFKGIYSKATFKCPKSMLKKYKSWLKKPGGAPKTAVFK